MLSSAARQKRYRHHSKGDHSLCDPKRCPGLGATPTNKPPAAKEPAIQPREVEVPPVALNNEYGARGAALMAEMVDVKLEPTHRVLLQEACRIADRLDRLDDMLRGRENWIQLRARNDEGTEVTVIVDQLLSEARQQATAFRGLVAELRAASPAVKRPMGRPAAVPNVSSGMNGGSVADLAARAARRRQSAG